MPSADLLPGEPVASELRDSVADRVGRLRDRGVVPTLGTVLASDDPVDHRFVELKHAACAEVGIATRDVRLGADVPTDLLHLAVDALCEDPEVHAVFVQLPLPVHVDVAGVRGRLDPRTDVDCLHPENLGRLVAGDPRFVPATTAAVCRLLDEHDVPVAGRDVVVVGRSDAIGKPLANRLIQKGPGGDATVTVCHSRTRDLGAHTRRADVLVTACGEPELVDGEMLSPGVAVVDVSANRVEGADGEATVVGDVEFASAAAVAGAITPVPGGVGPVTVATLLANVALAAERSCGIADGDE